MVQVIYVLVSVHAPSLISPATIRAKVNPERCDLKQTQVKGIFMYNEITNAYGIRCGTHKKIIIQKKYCKTEYFFI